MTSITDARGAVTSFEHDPRGNLTHVALPLGIDLRFSYDSFGQMLSASDGEGNTRTFAYDASGNRVKTVDPFGNVTQFQFDNLRRLTGAVDALNGTATLQWNALDRVIRAVNPLGNAAARSFDLNGNVAQITDANGRATNYSYDALDNLAKVTDAKAGTTQYGYAPPNCGCSTGSDLVSFSDASGVSHTQAYDFDERLTQTADPAGNLTRFAYNARGNLIAKTDANGARLQYEYDADSRLVHKIFPDGTDARFAYDAHGNLTAANNANTSVSFTYDDLNRIASTTDSRFGKTIGYVYNRNGRRVTLTDSEGGVTAYKYDANSRLTSVTGAVGAGVGFAYDALNRPAKVTYSNGVAATYQYDAASEITSLAYTAGQGPIAQFAYTYDKNGNPASMTGMAGVHTYQFDELNRLSAALHPATAAESYSYDNAGNRLTSATDSNYSYDAAGRLTSAEGASYSYDANGNLTSRSDSNGTTTYSYDFENRLTAIGFPDGTTAAYLYDALGRRIQKSVNGAVTNYLYDGSNILLEIDQAGAMLARYIHGPAIDQPLMMERGGLTYFYHADKVGSIAAVTDDTGNAVCSYTYDSFGRPQPCTALTSPFGFAGREYDAESGLVYMRARYYDPATGRFISSDPLDLTGLIVRAQRGESGLELRRAPQQLNPYSYAVNNPLAFRDPSGLKCGPLELTPLPGTEFFIARDLKDPNMINVVFRNGSTYIKARYILGNSEENNWAFYSFSGERIDIANRVDYPDFPTSLAKPPISDTEVRRLTLASSYVNTANALLDYLDPLHSRARLPDPVPDPAYIY